jgi:hypothetical protein
MVNDGVSFGKVLALSANSGSPENRIVIRSDIRLSNALERAIVSSSRRSGNMQDHHYDQRTVVDGIGTMLPAPEDRV